MHRIGLPLSIVLVAAVSASAGPSIDVADLLGPSIQESPLSLAQSDQPAPSIEESAASEAAPDVVDDPDAGVEVISHLPTRFEKGTRENVVTGARRAHAILNAAKPHAVAHWQKIFTSVHGALSRARITWPNPGYDFKACSRTASGNTLAFVIRGQRVIHLCAFALSSLSEKGTAQTLIHEASHVNGYFNECDATRVEVNAMRLSGEGVDYENVYWGRCGIN